MPGTYKKREGKYMIKKLWTFAAATAVLYGAQPSLEEFNRLDTVKSLGVKVKGVQEYGDLYVLDGYVSTRQGMKNITFTVTKDLKYTFYGTAFDNKRGEEIIFKKDMGPYIQKANFTYGTGKDEYLVFTDPQCPYCVKFEEALKQRNLEDKVKIHYFLFPLSHHGDAQDMSRFILNQSSNKMKLSALHDISVRKVDLFKGVKYGSEKLQELDAVIRQNSAIVEKLGVMGTPTLIDSNGQKVNIGEFFGKYAR